MERQNSGAPGTNARFRVGTTVGMEDGQTALLTEDGTSRGSVSSSITKAWSPSSLVKVNAL